MSKDRMVLIFLFGVFFIAIISAVLTSDDVDQICDKDNHTLYRWNGEWICGAFEDIEINYTINNVTNLYTNTSLHANNSDYLDGKHGSYYTNYTDAVAGSAIQNNTENGYIYKGDFQTSQNDFNWSVTDDGANQILSLPDVGGANYFEIATTGSFLQLYGNPNPSNNYLLATITETQGADTELNFYEGGTGHNRFWNSGSGRFGGNTGYLCSELTTDVDCDTSGTGADVVVEDDIWAGGNIFAEENITLNGSTISSWDEVNVTTDTSNLVPHTGATQDTDLGSYNLEADDLRGNELLIYSGMAGWKSVIYQNLNALYLRNINIAAPIYYFGDDAFTAESAARYDTATNETKFYYADTPLISGALFRFEDANVQVDNRLHIGDDSTTDPIIKFLGATNDGTMTYDESVNQLRTTTSLFLQPTTPTTSSTAILISHNPQPAGTFKLFRNLGFASTANYDDGDDDAQFTGIQSDTSAIYGGFGGFGSADRVKMKGYTTKVQRTAGTDANFPDSEYYGYYIEKVNGGVKENWGFYNNDVDLDNRLGGDTSKTYFGTGNDAYIEYDGTNMVFNTSAVGSGLAYFSNNISTTGVVTRTYTTNLTDEEAYNLVEYATENFYRDGVKNYSAWGECYAPHGITDYDRPEIEYFEEEVCIPHRENITETIFVDRGDGVLVLENQTREVFLDEQCSMEEVYSFDEFGNATLEGYQEVCVYQPTCTNETFEQIVYPHKTTTEGIDLECKQTMMNKADKHRVNTETILAERFITNTTKDLETMQKINDLYDIVSSKTIPEIKEFILKGDGALEEQVLYDCKTEVGSYDISCLSHYQSSSQIFIMKKISDLENKEAQRDACWDLNTQAEIVACMRAI